MIKIEHLETCGWEAALRGMRNPMNSWDKSDTTYWLSSSFGHPEVDEIEELGNNDRALMSKLCKGGSVHAKFRRMIKIYCDITAPLYWWKEFDTYKIGTVANSCSTMHTLCDKVFELCDFSCEKLYDCDDVMLGEICPIEVLYTTIYALNKYRGKWFDETDPKKKKELWYNMIQLLPSSYNQKRTVELNYEVLAGMYRDRKNHKLDEWREFCSTMKEMLPESWIFTGEENDRNE